MSVTLEMSTGTVNLDISAAGASSGTFDHRLLQHRDEVDQHPISAISGLPDALDEVDSDALSNFDILEIMQH